MAAVTATAAATGTAKTNWFSTYTLASVTSTTPTLAQILAAFPGLTQSNRAVVFSDGQIARVLSQGLTIQVSTLIGYGDVLNALGGAAGQLVLTALQALTGTTPIVQTMITLLAARQLDVSLPWVQAELAALVTGGTLTSTQQASLISLCTQPVSYTAAQVSNILNAAGY